MELVEDIVHHGKAGGGGNVSVVSEGQCPACGEGRNDASSSHRLSMEVTKALHREMAVLKGEIAASIDSMKREMVGLLSNLHENLQAYGDHRFLQASHLSPLEELDENTLGQMKGSHSKLSQDEKSDRNICPEEKYKSQSVPALHLLPLSSRNPMMLQVMFTITAQNSFWSSLSRSNSDPVEPLQAKSTTRPPPIPQAVLKKNLPKMVPPPATRTYSSNGKYTGKIATRVTKPLPPCSTLSTDPDGPWS